MKITAILFAIGFYLCCTGEPRADTSSAMQALCGQRGRVLAPLVDGAAARHELNPIWLVAQVVAESQCRPGVVNARTGAVGLMQIMPLGSANPRRLSAAALRNPATNIDLGAAHLARCLELCGSFGGAVAVYHGKSKCRGWQRDWFVQRVMRLVAKAQAEEAKS
jgi:soluble lytic murein transglycosylase-like protein